MMRDLVDGFNEHGGVRQTSLAGRSSRVAWTALGASAPGRILDSSFPLSPTAHPVAQRRMDGGTHIKGGDDRQGRCPKREHAVETYGGKEANRHQQPGCAAQQGRRQAMAEDDKHRWDKI